LDVKVTITSIAAEQFAALPRTVQVRVMRIFERLERWPDVSGAKPLRGDLSGWFRVRTGDYRILISASDDEVVVEKIGHRDGFYDE
jgi:mRNA interferase RelE/StbE